MQRAIPLLYHDVLGEEPPDYSGFSGTDAAEYKIPVEEFESHMEAVQNTLSTPPVNELDLDGDLSRPPVLLTFDDGGVSAYDYIAPMLESRGWHGVFFITTDRIDTPSFVTSEQLKELRQRGHTIGSHSCSHPLKITDCTHEQLIAEWKNSLKKLSDILEEPVSIASVPGGFYSREIAETAAVSGVKQLYTSEPMQKIHYVNGCAVIGRFSVKRGDSFNVPVDYVNSNLYRRFKVYAYWNLKKIAKVVAGPVYAWLRTYVLARR